MQKPTGNSSAPISGTPVLTVMVTANQAASVRIAPAIYARITVSRVDMKILDSPASTILVTNSVGIRYAITVPFGSSRGQAACAGFSRSDDSEGQMTQKREALVHLYG